MDQLTYTDYRNESPVRFFHAFKKAKTAENLDGFSGQTIYTPLLFSGSRGFVLFEAQKDKKKAIILLLPDVSCFAPRRSENTAPACC